MAPEPVEIAPEHLATVWRILVRVLPPETVVWAFGSRATRTAHRHSDLDLLVDVERPLTRREEVQLSEAFEESDLPYKVDVVDWRRISPGFRQAIEGERVLLQTAAPVSGQRPTAEPAGPKELGYG